MQSLLNCLYLSHLSFSDNILFLLIMNLSGAEYELDKKCKFDFSPNAYFDQLHLRWLKISGSLSTVW